jgi:hypothetical protein
VRDAAVFEFGYYRGSSGSGLFRRHPQSLLTLQTSVRGPSFPHPLSGHIYPRPVASYSWKYPVGPCLWPCLCGAPNSQFHQFSISYLRTDAVNVLDGQRQRSRPGLMVACQGTLDLLPRPRWRFLVGCIANNPLLLAI